VFGNYIKAGFDPEKEERRNLVGKLIIGGVVICGFYLWLDGRFATQVFQSWTATSLYYGDEFYVSRNVNLRAARFWKAMLATLPFHCAYLTLLLFLDHMFPQVMLKPVVFSPIILISFGIESAALSKLVKACFGEAG